MTEHSSPTGGEPAPTRGEDVSCHEVVRQLWEYIDAELTPERTALIRAHLDVCGRCFPQYDFERAFLEFLRRHREQPVPPALRQQVFRRLLGEDRGELER